MIFKKLSQKIALFLTILVACSAASSAQANQPFAISDKTWSKATTGIYSLVGLSAALISYASTMSLWDIATKPENLNQDKRQEKIDRFLQTTFSGAGVICGAFCAYKIFTEMQEAKSVAHETHALNALGSIRSVLNN